MPSNVQILVLEGDLSRGLTDLLVEQGYSAIRVADPSRIQSEAAGTALVIVDVLAPGMSQEGWRELSQGAEIPLLLIVPGPATEDWVGVISAPVDQDRLLQRIEALLSGTRSEAIQVGDLVIDAASWRVTVGGRRIALSPLESQLLVYLARRVGRVVTYDQLLEAVWGHPAGQGDPNLVIRCVSRLRKKLGEVADHPEYILNVPGMGYRLRSQREWERVAGPGRLAAELVSRIAGLSSNWEQIGSVLPLKLGGNLRTILLEEAIRTMALIGVVLYGVLPTANALGADVVRVAQFGFLAPFLIFPIVVWARAHTGWKLQITTRRAWSILLAFSLVTGAGLRLLSGVGEQAVWEQIVVSVLVIGMLGWLGARLLPLQ